MATRRTPSAAISCRTSTARRVAAAPMARQESASGRHWRCDVCAPVNPYNAFAVSLSTKQCDRRQSTKRTMRSPSAGQANVAFAASWSSASPGEALLATSLIEGVSFRGSVQVGDTLG